MPNAAKYKFSPLGTHQLNVRDPKMRMEFCVTCYYERVRCMWLVRVLLSTQHTVDRSIEKKKKTIPYPWNVANYVATQSWRHMKLYTNLSFSISHQQAVIWVNANVCKFSDYFFHFNSFVEIWMRTNEQRNQKHKFEFLWLNFFFFHLYATWKWGSVKCNRNKNFVVCIPHGFPCSD